MEDILKIFEIVENSTSSFDDISISERKKHEPCSHKVLLLYHRKQLFSTTIFSVLALFATTAFFPQLWAKLAVTLIFSLNFRQK
jgi:hypothetical protein